MSEILLQVAGLKTVLHGAGKPVRAVDGIDIEIRRGETFALVGESGSGKSMTALSIMRLLPETGRIAAGSVTLAGVDLLALPEAAMRMVRGRRVAMIFQEPATSLNPVLTIGHQIREVLERHTPLAGEQIGRRVIELIESVGIPDAARRAEEYPFQLSGGLKQRAMIAMALAAEPDLLIADEPTTALDVTIQAQVLDLLRELQRGRGMSMLLITHDLGIVAKMADRVAVMYAGQIVEVADRDRFFAAPQHPYSRKLFAALPDAAKRGGQLSVIKGQVPPLTTEFRQCRFADRCDFAFERCFKEAPGWTATGGSQLVRCHLREERGPAGALEVEEGAATSHGPQAAPGKPLLSVRDLKVHFPIRKGLFKRTVGYVKAVDGVALDIPAGRTLALVGESGCGKTTVGKAILQLIRPTSGLVSFDGVELTRLRGSELRASRSAFQIIFQDPYSSLNPRMRVADILAEGMSSLGVESEASARSRRVDELLEQVGLPQDARDRYPHEFSGGQRQRIAIARALAVRPRLIVCDEPTSALDVSVQAQILNLLKRLQAELGLSYLFITHNIAVVEYLAHEVSVMYLGRIVEHGAAEEVLRSPRHPYTEALLSAVPKIEGGREVIRLSGELPSPVHPPAGCHFHPRCPKVRAECRTRYPDTVTLPSGTGVACVLYGSQGGIAPAEGYEQDREEPSLSQELRQALDASQLQLVYQPQIDLKTGKVTGVEALLRWLHPDRGTIGPNQFIPMARESGLIRSMTHWVIETAVAQCSAWRSGGRALRVAVNITAQDLTDDLPEFALESLRKNAVPPGMLCLEITESGLTQNVSRATEVMRRLREAGIGRAIDDFATRNPTAEYVRQLQVDEIKIDRTFLRDIVDDRDDVATVHAAIELCHSLGLLVVAEGVEEGRLRELLEMLGCDQAQGFLFSRPMEPEEVLLWLAAREA